MRQHNHGVKPADNYHHRVRAMDGKAIDIYQSRQVSGAWLELEPGNAGKTLSVQSVLQGGVVQNYVGYRNGETTCDTLAIEVGDDGKVTIQVVLPGNPGEPDEDARIRSISFDQLVEAIRAMGRRP